MRLHTSAGFQMRIARQVYFQVHVPAQLPGELCAAFPLTGKIGESRSGIPNTGVDDRVIFYISVHFIKDYDKNYSYDQETLQGVSESGVVTFAKTR
jgi:hypothetical protein